MTDIQEAGFLRGPATSGGVGPLVVVGKNGAELGGGSGIAPTIFDAKGDVLVASAADTPARLAVGSNGQVLTADSAEADGLKWAVPDVTQAELDAAQTAIGNVSLQGQPGVYAPTARGFYLGGASLGGAALILASRFVVPRDMTIVKLSFQVTVADASNPACDVGIYDSSGNRIVNAGSAAGRLNSTGRKDVTVSSTPLTRGTVYYAAIGYAASGSPASIMCGNATGAPDIMGSGLPNIEAFYSGTGSTPLPAGPLAPVNNGQAPLIGVRES